MRFLLALAAALTAGGLAAVPAPGSASATPLAVPTTTARAAQHTHRVVVRPVDADGHRAAGWTVTRETGSGSVSCSGPAPSAVDDRIVECFPTALYLPACWKSQHHTALCLRDARTTALVRVRYSGSFGAAPATARPTPIDLDLWHGQTCDIRLGGAWSQLPSHPSWVGFDSCQRGSVYGPPSGDGVNRSHPVWTVHEWMSGTRQHVVTRRVRTAYFVGTAS